MKLSPSPIQFGLMAEASPRLWADERRKVATRALEWLCAAFFSVASGSRAATERLMLTLMLTFEASWERLFRISNLKWCKNGCFHYRQHFTNGSNIVFAEIQTEAPEFHKTATKGRKTSHLKSNCKFNKNKAKKWRHWLFWNVIVNSNKD